MDVFSLLKFWRNAGVGDPTAVVDDFDFAIDDEESFFDLVFANNYNDSDCGVASAVNVISGDHYAKFSKLDGADSKSNINYLSTDGFFSNNKRKILPLDSSNSKPPRSPFRVLMLGFQNHKAKLGKMEVKCEIEEVTISSLLKRDNSLRNKLRTEKFLDHGRLPSKRFSKDIVHKYLNLIKPLYVKVSKKARSPELFSTPSSSPATSSAFSPRTEEKQGGRAVFREVRKHLGKSRSSSSSSGIKTAPAPVVRRDDSVLQQQDGIQSAILHCKRSYNSPSQGCSVLSRSGSAPSQGAINTHHRISVDEEKRTSI